MTQLIRRGRKQQHMIATAVRRQTATDLPLVEWVEVDRHRAQEWLDNAAPNRTINKARVESYAEAMANGDWPVTGETLIFDKQGRMIQGQHRCLAIVQSDARLHLLCVFGVEQSVIGMLDQGQKRTFAQQLRLRGVPNYSHVATACVTLRIWEMRQVLSTAGAGRALNNSELFQVLDRWPEVHGAVIDARRVYDATRISTGLSTAARCIFGRVDEADAAAFFDRLASGAGLEETDAIYHLRRVFIDNSQRTTRKHTSLYLGAVYIKAFNAWRAGREVRQLKWKQGGAHAEDFPRIDDLGDA